MEPNSTHLENAEDLNYRKESNWHAFKSALYAALGSASFIGVLTNMVGMAINGIKAPEIGTTTLSQMIKTAFNINVSTGVAMAGVMAGLTVIGVACTYLAQEEYTEMKVLDNDRLARKQAECMAKQNAHGMETQQSPCAIEFEQNQRTDGKSWEQSIAKPNALTQAALH